MKIQYIVYILEIFGNIFNPNILKSFFFIISDFNVLFVLFFDLALIE